MELTTFDNYQALALRTEKPLPTAVARLNHAKLGLITEVGEIATEVKRMVIYGKPLDAERRDHIAEEIGDVLWYLAIASDALGLSIFRDNFPHLVPVVGGVDMLADLEHALTNLAITSGRFAHSAQSLALEEPVQTDMQQDLLLLSLELVGIAHLIDVDLECIAADNIRKLRERFPDAYSNEAAEARADKGGLDARNS